jgi:hypothetical protein
VLFVLTAVLRVPRLWPYLVSKPLPDAFQMPVETAGIRLGSALFVDAAHSLQRKV